MAAGDGGAGGGWEARPAPALGADTRAILEELGYASAEQIALARAGVAL